MGEVLVLVRHCLLALPGVAAGDLRRVVSHYQALAQCDGYLRRLPGVVREAADDTAGAAKMIAAGGHRRAAGRPESPVQNSPPRMCCCGLISAGRGLKSPCAPAEPVSPQRCPPVGSFRKVQRGSSWRRSSRCVTASAVNDSGGMCQLARVRRGCAAQPAHAGST